jgi:hypothetical protein
MKRIHLSMVSVFFPRVHRETAGNVTLTLGIITIFGTN